MPKDSLINVTHATKKSTLRKPNSEAATSSRSSTQRTSCLNDVHLAKHILTNNQDKSKAASSRTKAKLLEHLCQTATRCQVVQRRDVKSVNDQESKPYVRCSATRCPDSQRPDVMSVSDQDSVKCLEVQRRDAKSVSD